MTWQAASDIVAGGPMQEEMWEWYSNVVGDSNCVVIDNWGQTGNLAQLTISHALFLAATLSVVHAWLSV